MKPTIGCAVSQDLARHQAQIDQEAERYAAWEQRALELAREVDEGDHDEELLEVFVERYGDAEQLMQAIRRAVLSGDTEWLRAMYEDAKCQWSHHKADMELPR